MLRNLLAFLFFLGLGIAGAQAQLTMTNVGGGFGAGVASTYTGPADVVSGAASAAWMLRAYSRACATAHCNIGVFRRSSDNTTCTGKSDINGNLDLTTTGCAGSNLPTWCAASSGSCFVTTLYDQSGGTNCGGSACDMVQATTANQPPLIFNCVNTSLPCADFTTYPVSLGVTTGLSGAVPWSVASVNFLNSGAAATNCNANGCVVFISDPAGNYDVWEYFNSYQWCVADHTTGNCGTGTGVTDNTWHNSQAVINGTTLGGLFDGSSYPMSGGTTQVLAFQNDMHIGSDVTFGAQMTGRITEVIVYHAAQSGTDQTAVCHNEQAYWNTASLTAC